jgi:hypothetical protein
MPDRNPTFMYMSFCILHFEFCVLYSVSVFCSVCCEFYVHELAGLIAPTGNFKIVVGGVGTPVT